jgi:2-oxo-3-hexenedioate decarboxylase
MAPDREEVARRLIAAAREVQAIDAPFTDGEQFSEEAAYEIQDLVVADRVARSHRIIGAKLGLTSRAKQAQMNVDSPLYGWLTADMVLPDGQSLAPGRFIHPRVEPEIGFLIGETITAPASTSTVLAATSGVFAAIEIIDSRYGGFRFRHSDVIADNASSAGLITGPILRNVDSLPSLALIGCVMRTGGEVTATAAGAAVLGHPAASVAWLVNQLARRGKQLEAGTIVLSGALTDAVALAPGLVVTVEFEALGSLHVTMSDAGRGVQE